MLSVKASTHQCNPMFYGAGRQCVANSYMAMTKSLKKPLQFWQTEDLDDILNNGDKLYTELSASGQREPYLLISELNKPEVCSNFRFKINNIYSGDIHASSAENPFSTLSDAIQNIETFAFLTIKCYTMAVINNGTFYVFDPHARNDQGLPTVDGSAVLTGHSNKDELFNFVKLLSNNLCSTSANIPYELTNVTITSIDIEDNKHIISDACSTSSSLEFSGFSDVSDSEYTYIAKKVEDLIRNNSATDTDANPSNLTDSNTSDDEKISYVTDSTDDDIPLSVLSQYYKKLQYISDSDSGNLTDLDVDSSGSEYEFTKYEKRKLEQSDISESESDTDLKSKKKIRCKVKQKQSHSDTHKVNQEAPECLIRSGLGGVPGCHIGNGQGGAPECHIGNGLGGVSEGHIQNGLGGAPVCHIGDDVDGAPECHLGNEPSGAPKCHIGNGLGAAPECHIGSGLDESPECQIGNGLGGVPECHIGNGQGGAPECHIGNGLGGVSEGHIENGLGGAPVCHIGDDVDGAPECHLGNDPGGAPECHIGNGLGAAPECHIGSGLDESPECQIGNGLCGVPECHIGNGQGGAPECHIGNGLGGVSEGHIENGLGGVPVCHIGDDVGGAPECHLGNDPGGASECHIGNGLGVAPECHIGSGLDESPECQIGNGLGGAPGNQSDIEGALDSQESIDSGVGRPCTEDVYRGRKRKRNPEKWTRNIRKRLKNSGKKFYNRNGKVVSGRYVKPGCGQKCRYKCQVNFNSEERDCIFHKYWGLGNIEQQRQFLFNHSSPKPKASKRLNSSSKRNISCAWSLPQNDGTQVRVCKTFFLDTLNVSAQMVRTAIRKSKIIPGVCETDRRGKHLNRPNRTKQTEIEYIKAHINSYPRVESHYCRKDSKKEYLEQDLNLAELHRQYKEKCREDERTSVSQGVYRSTFDNCFNIGFMKPLKDQCDMCVRFRNASDVEKVSIQSEYDLHIKNKESARAQKNHDKEKAESGIDDYLLAACFDLEKVLLTPKGKASSLYYRRRLNSFNLSIYNLGTSDANCYVWNESIASRGACEISSCVYDFLKYSRSRGKQKFIFFSDNCSSQNKNRYYISMLWYAMKTLKLQSIKHKYLQKGHTQSENDSVHAAIESHSEVSKPIYTTPQWATAIRGARKSKKAYEVKEMDCSDFFNFKKVATVLKNFDLDTDRQKVNWLDILTFSLSCESPNIVGFKYNYDGPVHYINLIQKVRRSTEIPNPLNIRLEQLYEKRPHITYDKYKDLMRLCRDGIIPSVHHQFFSELPHDTE
ncbi:uncharacterized protein LOC128556283 [Mercenaria mercenaria]|uniref:uncharacterized protein LOC128556283 n=1 Tax=Mercenaria mercenaria TaxID=6596 RepID=UPI00234FAA8A|nr:uncharacterized protein LOC128556283 [Mercenaria mercenaria]